MIVYLNGEYLPREEARVPAEDRGFLFGDGVYEVIRAAGGRLFEADAHLRRLERGAEALGIALPGELEADRARELMAGLLERNGRAEGDATVYIQVTRGAAVRTHRFPPADTRPTVFLYTADFTPAGEIQERGADAIRHADLRWSRCDLKTVNLLPNVLAKQKAVEAGAAEAIFVREGLVTEGASTNVFAVADGTLRTHPATHGILPGVTRSVILDIAAERGMEVEEEPIPSERLPGGVTELFLTGTTTDVLPVVRLDGQEVGSGECGPVTRALQDDLSARIYGGRAASRE